MLVNKNYFRFFRLEEKIISILIILFPISLITGPLIPDLIVTICSLAFIYKIFKDNEFYNFLIYNYKKEIFVFLIFFIIIILSLLNSSIIKNSFLSSFFYFRFFLFLLVVSYVFYKYPKIITALTISIIAILIILFLDSIIQYYFKKNILLQEVKSHYDLIYITSFFGDEKRLGSYISRILPICIALTIFLNNKFINKYLAKELIIFFSFILVFLSTERMALLYFFIFIFFYFFTLNKKIKIIFSFLTIVLFIGTINIFPNYLEKIYKTTINQIYEKEEKIEQPIGLKSIKTSAKPLYFSRNHQNMILTSYNIFKENIFFGNGIKTFREECKKKKYKLEQRCSTHPHNTYLQLLSETGLFSFLLVFFIFFYLLCENIKIIFKRNLSTLDHSILISNVSVMIPIFPMVPSGNFYNNWISCLIFLSLTINIYIRKNLN
jgi:hypothetical protein